MPLGHNDITNDIEFKECTPPCKSIPPCGFCGAPLPKEESDKQELVAKRDEKYVRKQRQYIDSLVPKCSYEWTQEDVENWIVELGFPQYKNVMTENFITGKKLILLDANNLCKMGIKDFKHIKKITESVRNLLGIKLTHFTRSVAAPHREPLALYLEQKCLTGKKTDALTYSKFLNDYNLHYDDD
ncbi:sterile alpha motif domain-containing protein 15-like [Centruroides sculpturatus]|uniref:sterile alpha motif domain-containing protein 15-like n=1 Tax=Centruroides sculpturatus TaxID=218467 RepID=UPI000C6DC810|nr:sterile alpha motif domain-containing protein 15-like [Centruroides sculpturatus]